MGFINNIRIRTKLLLVLGLTGLSLAGAIWASTSILHQRMLQDRIAKLRAVVEIAAEQAQALDAQVKAGKLTLDEAMARYKDVGRGMWFDDHRAYVGIVGYDGIWFMNAAVPKIEGTRGNTMPDGRYISEVNAAAVKNSEEGLAAYDYPKPGQTEALPKMTYVKKFAPWKLLITAGVWTDDLEADFMAVVWRLAGYGLVLLLITGGLILLLSANITRALSGLRDKMVRLVGGDLAVEVDEAGRADEIGEMAKAVQVFKSNAVEMQALQAEQKKLGAGMG